MRMRWRALIVFLVLLTTSCSILGPLQVEIYQRDAPFPTWTPKPSIEPSNTPTPTPTPTATYTPTATPPIVISPSPTPEITCAAYNHTAVAINVRQTPIGESGSYILGAFPVGGEALVIEYRIVGSDHWVRIDNPEYSWRQGFVAVRYQSNNLVTLEGAGCPQTDADWENFVFTETGIQGIHHAGGPARWYWAQYVTNRYNQSLPVAAKCVDDFAPCQEAEQLTNGQALTVCRYYGGQDTPGGNFGADGSNPTTAAIEWYNRHKSYWQTHPPCDIYETDNEPKPSTAQALHWYTQNVLEQIRLAHRDGYRLAIGCFATGSWDAAMLTEFAPALTAAYHAGFFLCTHEYSLGPIMSLEAPDLIGRFALYQAWLTDLGLPAMPHLITEAGYNGGHQFVSPDLMRLNYPYYAALVRESPQNIAFFIWTTSTFANGNFAGANLMDVLPWLSTQP